MVPKVNEWDFHRDHGIVRLASEEDLDRMRPMVSQIDIKVEETTAQFRAFAETFGRL